MAKNESRSQNFELDEGMTDGAYKKLAPDRGGLVESESNVARANLHREQFGMEELPPALRHLPDGS